MKAQAPQRSPFAFASAALALSVWAIQPAQAASFATTGLLSTGHSAHTATLLPNGKVLVAGGTSEPTTELYEPDVAGLPPSLSLSLNPDQTLNLSWTGAGTPEQTGSLSGPNWQPASSQANPQTLTAAGGAKFFRVKSE